MKYAPLATFGSYHITFLYDFLSLPLRVLRDTHKVSTQVMNADLGIPLPTGPALGGFGKNIFEIIFSKYRAAHITLSFLNTHCNVQFPFSDPFAEDTTSVSKKGADTKDYVHVRVQQRNGKKSLTTVQGLPQTFDYKKILKALKKGKPLAHMCARRRNCLDYLRARKLARWRRRSALLLLADRLGLSGAQRSIISWASLFFASPFA